MATRTVRLDAEAEEVLRQIQRATGLPISEALKRGLRSLQEQVARDVKRTPYDVYKELDLGPGGYTRAPSTDVKRAVRAAIKKKHGR